MLEPASIASYGVESGWTRFLQHSIKPLAFMIMPKSLPLSHSPQSFQLNDSVKRFSYGFPGSMQRAYTASSWRRTSKRPSR